MAQKRGGDAALLTLEGNEDAAVEAEMFGSNVKRKTPLV